MTGTQGNRGFTLVELLVVIAIIALLVAIVIPAISSALGRARRLACVAHLRGLGQATSSYALDNYGFIPFRREGSNYANPPWFNLLAPYAGATVRTLISLEPGTDKLFRCPAQRGDFAISFGPSSGGLLDDTRLHMDTITHPSMKVWLLDVPPGNVYFFNPSMHSQHWLAPRHDDGVNALFFDGHVAGLSKEDVEEQRPLMFQATRFP